MGRPLQELRRFLRELKRRNVYRVGVTYAVVAFVVWQAASLLFPALEFPGWTVDFVIVLTILGFPIALVLAWAFEVTPEGVRRTPAGEGTSPAQEGDRSGRFGVKALVGLGVAAAAVAGGWYLVGGDRPTDGGSTPGGASVAVLPFENMGGEESEQFTRGVHDGLLTRLSSVSDLRVISRTSVMQYRETDKTIPEIAREVDARWIVEGAVQEAGGQVQVNAQLIRAPEDDHRWAETYRRELTTENLFAIQSELTKRIARSLEAEISPEEEERVERRPTGDLEAYRLYVQGRTHLEGRTPEAIRRALAHFERAIDRDSSYALAWTGLADARSLLAGYGFGSPDTLYPGALDAVRRALEIEPELAEARASLGLIEFDWQQDGPAALRSLRRAAELEPSYARAHHWLGLVLATIGRPAEARAALERAVELDPMSPSIRVALGAMYKYAGRRDEALREGRRARELAPEFPVVSHLVGMVLLEMDRTAEAADSLRRVLEAPNPSPVVSAGARALLAIARHRMGERVDLREIAAGLEEDGHPVSAALVHVEAGRREAALEALEDGPYEVHSLTLVLRYEPLLDPLRDEPRFRDLLRRVNAAWGLEPDGRLSAAVGPGPGTLDARRAPGQVIPSDPRPGPNVYDGARAALLPSSPD